MTFLGLLELSFCQETGTKKLDQVQCMIMHGCCQSGSPLLRPQKEITHTLFRQFFAYSVKDPLISEVETQFMSVGGVY